jgi:O-antigen/teichoic acid export membrane protein
MRVSGDNSAHEQDLIVSRPKRWLWSASALLIKLIGHKWFLTLVDQSIISGTSVLVGIIIGRTCGKEQLGLYILGTSIIGLIIIAQDSIIWSPYAVFSPRLSGTAHSLYAGSTFLHQIALSGLAMMVLAGVGVFLSGAVAGGGLGSVVWTLLAVGSAITFREYIRRICFAHLQMKASLLIDGGVAFVLLSGLGLLVYLGKLSASRAFAVIGGGCALAGLVWVLWAWKTMAFSLKQALQDLRHNLAFGRWILGANFAVFLSNQLSLWFLTWFHGVAAVGTFAACQGIVALANPFLAGSGLFLKVKTAHVLAQGGIDKLRGLVIRSTLVIALGMSLFSMVVFIAGDHLVSLVYGPEYAGHRVILATLALRSLADALEHGIYYGLLAMEKPDLLFKINLLRVGIMLTIGYWLVKAMGPLGAAAGLLISDLAALLTQGWLFRKSFYASENLTTLGK